MFLARDIQNPLQTIAQVNPIGRMVRLFLISNLALFLLSNCVEGFQFHSHRVSQNAFSELSDHRVSRSHRVQHMTKDNDDVDMKTFFVGNEGEFARDLGRLKIDLPRFVAYNLLAVALAFGSNFLGVTSAVMSATNPEYFRSARFDQLYSVGGFRRHVDVEDKYEYIFPENWLFDRSIMLADARERDMPKTLRDRKQAAVRPDSAYGPDQGNGQPGDGRENLSVIKSNVMPGFTLERTLGEPKEAAERLLQNVIAPPGSGKKYELINAYADNYDGSPAYIFEYTVQKEASVSSTNVPRGGFYQHSISVIMSRGTELFTLTGVAPESKWEDQKQTIKRITESFRIASPTVPEGFY
jgi:PsbP